MRDNGPGIAPDIPSQDRRGSAGRPGGGAQETGRGDTGDIGDRETEGEAGLGIPACNIRQRIMLLLTQAPICLLSNTGEGTLTEIRITGEREGGGGGGGNNEVKVRGKAANWKCCFCLSDIWEVMKRLILVDDDEKLVAEAIRRLGGLRVLRRCALPCLS